jgi:hypothetical protein
VESRIGHVLILDDVAGIVEDPEVAFIRKSVLLTARDVRCIQRDQREDFVAVREECVRLKAAERFVDLFNRLDVAPDSSFWILSSNNPRKTSIRAARCFAPRGKPNETVCQ